MRFTAIVSAFGLLPVTGELVPPAWDRWTQQLRRARVVQSVDEKPSMLSRTPGFGPC